MLPNYNKQAMPDTVDPFIYSEVPQVWGGNELSSPFSKTDRLSSIMSSAVRSFKRKKRLRTARERVGILRNDNRNVAKEVISKEISQEKSINDVLLLYRGRALRELRKKGNLSQEQLSKLTGISEGFISSLENGTRQPSDISLLKISDALNVPANYFDLKAMVMGKDHLNTGLRSAAEKLEPILDEILSQYKK